MKISKIMATLVATMLVVALATPAEAKKRHHKPVEESRVSSCVENNDGRTICSGFAHVAQSVQDASGNVVGHRPSGCPHAFCGCEASLYLFHEIRPELNLAANWIRKFARTSPAPGMAAARNHHVMVLMSHVEGSDWLVHDGNSGGGLTRDHVRSISGYVIVDPRSSRMAMR